MHRPCYNHGWPGRVQGDKFGAAQGPKHLQHHETVLVSCTTNAKALLSCRLLADCEASGGGLECQTTPDSFRKDANLWWLQASALVTDSYSNCKFTIQAAQAAFVTSSTVRFIHHYWQRTLGSLVA
jgi:hypothetical protein